MGDSNSGRTDSNSMSNYTIGPSNDTEPSFTAGSHPISPDRQYLMRIEQRHRLRKLLKTEGMDKIVPLLLEKELITGMQVYALMNQQHEDQKMNELENIFQKIDQAKISDCPVLLSILKAIDSGPKKDSIIYRNKMKQIDNTTASSDGEGPSNASKPRKKHTKMKLFGNLGQKSREKKLRENPIGHLAVPLPRKVESPDLFSPPTILDEDEDPLSISHAITAPIRNYQSKLHNVTKTLKAKEGLKKKISLSSPNLTNFDAHPSPISRITSIKRDICHSPAQVELGISEFSNNQASKIERHKSKKSVRGEKIYKVFSHDDLQNLKSMKKRDSTMTTKTGITSKTTDTVVKSAISGSYTRDQKMSSRNATETHTKANNSSGSALSNLLKFKGIGCKNQLEVKMSMEWEDSPNRIGNTCHPKKKSSRRKTDASQKCRSKSRSKSRDRRTRKNKVESSVQNDPKPFDPTVLDAEIMSKFEDPVTEYTEVVDDNQDKAHGQQMDPSELSSPNVCRQTRMNSTYKTLLNPIQIHFSDKQDLNLTQESIENNRICLLPPTIQHLKQKRAQLAKIIKSNRISCQNTNQCGLQSAIKVVKGDRNKYIFEPANSSINHSNSSASSYITWKMKLDTERKSNMDTEITSLVDTTEMVTASIARDAATGKLTYTSRSPSSALVKPLNMPTEYRKTDYSVGGSTLSGGLSTLCMDVDSAALTEQHFQPSKKISPAPAKKSQSALNSRNPSKLTLNLDKTNQAIDKTNTVHEYKFDLDEMKTSPTNTCNKMKNFGGSKSTFTSITNTINSSLTMESITSINAHMKLDNLDPVQNLECLEQERQLMNRAALSETNLKDLEKGDIVYCEKEIIIENCSQLFLNEIRNIILDPEHTNFIDGDLVTFKNLPRFLYSLVIKTYQWLDEDNSNDQEKDTQTLDIIEKVRAKNTALSHFIYDIILDETTSDIINSLIHTESSVTLGYSTSHLSDISETGKISNQIGETMITKQQKHYERVYFTDPMKKNISINSQNSTSTRRMMPRNRNLSPPENSNTENCMTAASLQTDQSVGLAPYRPLFSPKPPRFDMSGKSTPLFSDDSSIDGSFKNLKLNPSFHSINQNFNRCPRISEKQEPETMSDHHSDEAPTSQLYQIQKSASVLTSQTETMTNNTQSTSKHITKSIAVGQSYSTLNMTESDTVYTNSTTKRNGMTLSNFMSDSKTTLNSIHTRSQMTLKLDSEYDESDLKDPLDSEFDETVAYPLNVTNDADTTLNRSNLTEITRGHTVAITRANRSSKISDITNITTKSCMDPTPKSEISCDNLKSIMKKNYDCVTPNSSLSPVNQPKFYKRPLSATSNLTPKNFRRKTDFTSRMGSPNMACRREQLNSNMTDNSDTVGGRYSGTYSAATSRQAMSVSKLTDYSSGG